MFNCLEYTYGLKTTNGLIRKRVQSAQASSWNVTLT